MLILTPLTHEDSAFAEEILADLIEESDKIAEAATTNHIDITDELFND